MWCFRPTFGRKSTKFRPNVVFLTYIWAKLDGVAFAWIDIQGVNIRTEWFLMMTILSPIRMRNSAKSDFFHHF